MVDSLPYYKVSKSPDQTDESELVACIAAVARYMSLEEEGPASKGVSNHEDLKRGRKSTRSAWGVASLLEGGSDMAVNERHVVRHRPLWRSSQLLCLLFLSFALCVPPAISNASSDDSPLPSETESSSPASDDSIICVDLNVASRSPGNVSAVSVNGYERRLKEGGKIAIRVALALNVSDLSVDTIDGADVLDPSTGTQVARLSSMSQWRFSPRTTGSGEPSVSFTGKRNVDKFLICLGEPKNSAVRSVAYFPGATAVPAPSQAATTGNMIFSEQGVPFTPNTAPTTLKSLPGHIYSITGGVLLVPDRSAPDGSQYVFSLNGRMYRGALWLKDGQVKDKNGRTVTRLTAINILDLEEYLMSVLPSEMPSSWPREALKAQAIAARSYALASLGKYEAQGFDIKASVLDQVYRGVAAETVNCNQAVADTRGIIIKHRGQVVPAFFHCTSAGHTDLSENVFTRESSYLKSVPDLDVKSKYVTWERKIPLTQVQNAFGKDVGSVLGLFPVHRSLSGRVKNLLVAGANGTSFVAGTKVRESFALPSTNFNVLAEQNAYVFKGQGFGHGLGMSQWGARTLAEHGYNAAQILTYYYKDVTFEQLVETRAL